MHERGARKLDAERVRVACRDDIVPVEQVFAQALLPARGGRGERDLGEAFRSRMRIRVEGGLAVTGVTRPPSDGHLLAVHRVAHDEVLPRWLGRLAREEADG